MKSEKSVFERLSAINVNEHVEKKDNLTYLSWAWAWSVTKKECPDASYTILPTDYDDDLGFMCHTSVTIEGQTLEMWLPVMDGLRKENPSVAYQKIDIDSNSDVAQQYGVRAVPTVIFEKNGTVVQQVIGVNQKSYYQSIITSI